MREQDAMANQSTKVVSICRGTSLQVNKEEIVELAFERWLERFGERYGSPVHDFLGAWQEVRTRTTHRRKRGAALFLVTKRPS